MMKSSKLAWIAVSDLKKTRRFFVDTLGLKEVACNEEWGWAEMECKEAGLRIGITGKDKAGHRPVSNAVITFTVANIEKVREMIKKKGAQLLGEVMEVPAHCKLQLFCDADGNKFQLYENIEKK